MIRLRRSARLGVRWVVREFFSFSTNIDLALQRVGIYGRPSPTLTRLSSWSHDPR